MTEIEIKSYIEEVIGILWALAAFVAASLEWKIVFFLCAFNSIFALVCGIIYSIQHLRRKRHERTV